MKLYKKKTNDTFPYDKSFIAQQRQNKQILFRVNLTVRYNGSHAHIKPLYMVKFDVISPRTIIRILRLSRSAGWYAFLYDRQTHSISYAWAIQILFSGRNKRTRLFCIAPLNPQWKREKCV